MRSKLVRMEIYNFGCFGPEGVVIELDNILCLVGENNAGKSTVLKAYEYAVENRSISFEDKCKSSKEDDFPIVIIHVHIPENTPSIAEKWKIKENDLLLVKSKWQWDNKGSITRTTWDPEKNDYAADEKASGLDNVFSSRLPKPFRIGTLDAPEEEHKKLLTLILQPISDKLKSIIADEKSDLSCLLNKITELANQPIEEEKKNLELLSKALNKAHNAIFPKLSIDIDVNIGNIPIDPIKLLKENSHIKISEWAKEFKWSQQGTGSQRALFWAMMQVRSELNTLNEFKIQKEKGIEQIKKTIEKLYKERDKAKTDKTKNEKNAEIAECEKRMQDLFSQDAGVCNGQKEDQMALPSYMLLIDEPEVALHPKAVRTASSYLYNLAKDPSWQVMLTTHSPIFVNPFEDHTTIIRLTREKENPAPKTYISDTAIFSDVQKINLKLINKLDTNLSEMFFGGYPILVEGDTEFTAFEYILQTCRDEFVERPLLVRAHGKSTICLLIKILRHFKMPFSVIHDSDYPCRKNGKINSAWTVNSNIFSEIEDTRKAGIRVMHKVSIPYFELAYNGIEVDDNGDIVDADYKDKPWNMLMRITNDDCTKSSIKEIFKELCNTTSTTPTITERQLLDSLAMLVKDNNIKDKRIAKE